MKRTILTAIFALITFVIFAQSPLMINYQAVLRDNLGNIMLNEDVSIDVKIIKGTVDGVEVFSETHNTSTNNFGLVNLVIGSIESMDGINWGNDDYFVQIWLDGTEMGTSQLLSVPYALHSKTAETVENIEITGNETVFDNWDKDVSDDFDGDYNNLINLPIIPEVPENLSEFNNDAGFITEFVELDGDPINEIEMPINAAEGDMSYFDGTEWVKIEAPIVVPDLTYTMEWDTNNNKPYWKTNYPELKSVIFNGTLYVAPENNSDGTDWGADNIWVSATSTIDGQANTTEIVTEAGEGSYAAYICDNLNLYGYTDWYLPAIDELDALYQNKNEIGGMNSGLFWSSTEVSSGLAKEINFSDGSQINDGKNLNRKVRCVRRD